ncbi:MAG: hypothetical protein CMO10_04190 [Thalassospira sp.]|nr:hypothetical protein [Thalassospira sp.]
MQTIITHIRRKNFNASKTRSQIGAKPPNQNENFEIVDNFEPAVSRSYPQEQRTKGLFSRSSSVWIRETTHRSSGVNGSDASQLNQYKNKHGLLWSDEYDGRQGREDGYCRGRYQPSDVTANLACNGVTGFGCCYMDAALDR